MSQNRRAFKSTGTYTKYKRLEEVISSLIDYAFHTIVPMPLPTSPQLMEPKECYRAEEARNEHPLLLTLHSKLELKLVQIKRRNKLNTWL